MKKLIKSFVMICVVVSVCSAQEDYSFVNEIIDQVNLDTVIRYVSDLSGEDSVEIDSNTSMIQSRHKNYPGNDIAANYSLSSLGLDFDSC